MAGRGSRLRPHTLITPKPLVCVAGKPIVQHLVEEIVSVCDEKIEEIAFIIGDFGKEVEESLCNIALKLGAKPKIYFQKKPLGTAHAILCAKNSLKGNCVVAFADTLFKAKFKLDKSKDGNDFDCCRAQLLKKKKKQLLPHIFQHLLKHSLLSYSFLYLYYFLYSVYSFLTLTDDRPKLFKMY